MIDTISDKGIQLEDGRVLLYRELASILTELNSSTLFSDGTSTQQRMTSLGLEVVADAFSRKAGR